MSKVKVLDNHLENFIQNLEESDDDIPYKIGLNGKNYLIEDYNLLTLQDEENELKLIGNAKESHTIPTSGTREIPSYYYILDEENEKAWYIESEQDYKLSPKLIIKSSNITGKYFYSFKEGTVYHLHKERPQEKENQNINRPNNTIKISNITKVSDHVPIEFFAVTDNNNYLYIRYRSGNLKVLYSKDKDPINGETIVKAFFGKDWPGMNLSSDEVLNIISGLDYIELSENMEEVDSDVLEDLSNMDVLKDMI